MNHFATVKVSDMKTGKIFHITWTNRGVTVDSLITFVSINSRPTKTSAKTSAKKSSFINDYYFSKTKKFIISFQTPKSANDVQIVKPQNPKDIYSVFEAINMVCTRDRCFSMNPTRMFTFTTNIISYTKQVEPTPKKSKLENEKSLNSDSRKPHEESSLKDILLDKTVRDIREYYDQCAMAERMIVRKIPVENSTITTVDLKYWKKRHIYFEKFNLGILLDKESFYSVCPESLAYHIAKRCANEVVLDPFCGAGGNAIQLAFTCKKVIAMDVDPKKIQMARYNAKIYEVDHKIDFHVGDFFGLSTGSSPRFRADAVFMSPPWGGPEYSAKETYSLSQSMCQSQGGGDKILQIAKTISNNVALHLPRNTNVRELISMAKVWGKIEVQQNLLDEKLNSITAFFGEFKTITNGDSPQEFFGYM